MIYPFVRPSQEADVKVLASRMRSQDIIEIEKATQQNPFEALDECYRGSKYCFSLVGREVDIMFGVCWTANPRIGTIWMLGSDFIDTADINIRLPLLLRSRRLFRDLLRGHDILSNNVYRDNTAAFKFVKWLGFEEIERNTDGFSYMVYFSSPQVREIYVNSSWPPCFDPDLSICNYNSETDNNG